MLTLKQTVSVVVGWYRHFFDPSASRQQINTSVCDYQEPITYNCILKIIKIDSVAPDGRGCTAAITKK